MTKLRNTVVAEEVCGVAESGNRIIDSGVCFGPCVGLASTPSRVVWAEPSFELLPSNHNSATTAVF